MEILVSFCNVSMPGAAALGVLDPDMTRFRIAQLPAEFQAGSGITGLTLAGEYLYVAQQGGRLRTPKLAVFDRADLRFVGRYQFRTAGDVHSIWVEEDRLYAVSTGTDEVLALGLQGTEVVSEEVLWRPEPGAPRADLHHVNSIYGWRGDLLVSGFGKKAGQSWSTALDGFIYNISRGEKIASEIYHPHTLTALGGSLACCESGQRAVRVVGEERAYDGLPGYTRGLCVIGSRLFVGTSAQRKVSKSTGRVNPPNSGVPAGRCAVSRLSLDSFEIEATIDLSAYGSEIYDLLAVEDTNQWPIAPSNEPYTSHALWRRQVGLAAEEIAGLIPPADTFILVDGNQWQTDRVFAGRRRVLYVEQDGQYWGAPLDDNAAIDELERLRQGGARFMVFGWPAFWWLDYYVGMRQHLRTHFPCLLENDRLVVFDVRPAEPSPASEK
jgi:uncharacterized protein DUF4915